MTLCIQTPIDDPNLPPANSGDTEKITGVRKPGVGQKRVNRTSPSHVMLRYPGLSESLMLWLPYCQ